MSQTIETQDALVPLVVRTVAATLDIPLHLERLERNASGWLNALPTARLSALRGLVEASENEPRRLEDTEGVFELDLELCDEDRHHRRVVGRLTEILARGVGIAEGPAYHIGRAAELHDVGKVLLGTQDDAEAHTWAGALLLGPTVGFAGRLARQIAVGHHEQWSGEGFPLGLSGARIPLAARLARVAIHYVDRVTGHGASSGSAEMPPAWVRSELCRMACPAFGAELDPTVVAALFRERSAIDRAMSVC